MQILYSTEPHHVLKLVISVELYLLIDDVSLDEVLVLVFTHMCKFCTCDILVKFAFFVAVDIVNCLYCFMLVYSALCPVAAVQIAVTYGFGYVL